MTLKSKIWREWHNVKRSYKNYVGNFHYSNSAINSLRMRTWYSSMFLRPIMRAGCRKGMYRAIPSESFPAMKPIAMKASCRGEGGEVERIGE
jgi:hypothetical protein